MVNITFRSLINKALWTGVLGVAFLALGCGTAATATLIPQPSNPGATTSDPTDSGESGVTPILATTVLRVGAQRVAFLLEGPQGLIDSPSAEVTPVFIGEHAGSLETETRQARFHIWPYGVRGAYSTELDFPKAGDWRLDIAAEDKTGPVQTSLRLKVAEESPIPDIGQIPPLTRNKTLATVANVEDLTTDYTPDLDLYQLSLDQAIKTDLPTVVVFATPAFCTSPTCGPQVDAVSELKDTHKEDANFIHVEYYDNPSEIQGDLSKAQLVSHADDWGFSTIPGWLNESWVFVLDSSGRIHQRFEGFTTVEEMEEALRSARAKP
ncbi:MAG: hypothetical protein BZY80_06685 [SAR202 cluster bacterium Io17-Chloro-G2]|nr:MAG: hypothetical protein BZY80_06685 [SAR202 cluster bacterium Io17-Chloro-G2]